MELWNWVNLNGIVDFHLLELKLSGEELNWNVSRK